MCLHCTGAGKAIFAHTFEAERDAVIEQHGLPKKTERTTTDRDELEDELAEIRETGLSFDEERVDGIEVLPPPSRTARRVSSWAR